MLLFSLQNRKLLVSLLSRLNCVAIGVEDGQQCVDLFRPFFSNEPNTADQAQGGASTREQRSASASTTVHNAAAASKTEYPFDIILMVRSPQTLVAFCFF